MSNYLSQDDVNRTDAFLEHHGILGMKWGVRRYQNKDGSLTNAGKKRQQRIDAKQKVKNEKALNKLATKDAKRFADAKMFYGKTAGTKRKLLKAELDKKKKNTPGYEKAFNEAVNKADFAKSAKKAVRKRHAIDAKYRARVTTKQVLGVTGPLTVAAGTALYSANKQKVDSFVATQFNRAVSAIRK